MMGSFGARSTGGKASRLQRFGRLGRIAILLPVVLRRSRHDAVVPYEILPPRTRDAQAFAICLTMARRASSRVSLSRGKRGTRASPHDERNA